MNDNLFDWNVCLKSFSKSSKLHKDLMKLKEMKGEDAGIVLNITFTDTYPRTPPLVRVVEPVLACWFIHSGGAICFELLTPQGWNPEYTMEALIVQMANYLIIGSARIKFKKKVKFCSLDLAGYRNRLRIIIIFVLQNTYSLAKAKETVESLAEGHAKIGKL